MAAPLIATDIDMSPLPSSNNSSTWHDAQEYPMQEEYYEADDVFTTRPFPTMEDLCEEMGHFYPLERQTRANYIEHVGSYNGLVMYSPSVTMTVTEVREKPMQKVTRQVSVVGRQAKKLSGGLGRKASKLLRLTTTPDLVRNKQRTTVDDDDEWGFNHQVELGREVEAAAEPDDHMSYIDGDISRRRMGSR
jgi:hypothetical protein